MTPNSRASATRAAGQHIMSQASSRRHTSSSISAHSDRGKASNAIIDHEHLSRVVDMNDQGKRAVRADLDLNFDPGAKARHIGTVEKGSA
jgi:hypothetical protein